MSSIIAAKLIEEHPTHYKKELAFITSAYLQPRRNLHGAVWKNDKKSPKSTRNQPSPVSPKNSPPLVSYKISPPSANFGNYQERNVFPRTRNYTDLTPRKTFAPRWAPPPQSIISEIPKPCFVEDVADLSQRLNKLNTDCFRPISEANNSNSRIIDSLFDSGNSSPDDFSFNSQTHKLWPMKQSLIRSSDPSRENQDIYPFGSIHLCLPKTNFNTISRCSSFNSEDSFCISDLTRFM